MAKRDFYEVLGVSRQVSEKELKTAFRELAMRYHPDRNQGDPTSEQKFKEINEAYEVLKDPQKRAAYDQLGHQAFEMGNGGGGSGFSASGMPDFFEDLFGDFMGMGTAGGSKHRDRSGSDLRYDMTISLEDAYKGKVEKIKVKSQVSCSSCSGSGAKTGSGQKTCSACNGSGKIHTKQGFFRIERGCQSCQGYGKIIEAPCSECKGMGHVERERTLSVNVPAGVEDDMRIRLSGEGEAGTRGAPAGDLYIFLTVKPHDFFKRKGSDLLCSVPVSMTVAALGGQIDVPTIEGGCTKVKIPEGIQSGKHVRLKGKGMPIMRTSRHGDMYIQVTVETPCNLNKKQRELLQQFQDLANDENNPESASFFTKVKGFFDGLGGN